MKALGTRFKESPFASKCHLLTLTRLGHLSEGDTGGERGRCPSFGTTSSTFSVTRTRDVVMLGLLPLLALRPIV